MNFTWTTEKTILAALVIVGSGVLLYFHKLDVSSTLTWMGAIFVALGLETKK